MKGIGLEREEGGWIDITQKHISSNLVRALNTKIFMRVSTEWATDWSEEVAK